MTVKKLKKLMLIGFGILVVIGLVVYGIFFMDWNTSGSQDYETVKATGGYEMLKSDIASITKCKDSQAATIADAYFEKIGIQKYEGMTKGGLRGNYTVRADGYNIDSYIVSGIFRVAYIGNVAVYVNTKDGGSALPTALDYTYKQYQNIVDSFSKNFDVTEANAKNIYEKLTLKGFNAFSEVSKGKLKEANLSGYYAYEGNMKYFIAFNSDKSDISKVYVICDVFDPMQVYDASGNSPRELSEVKVLSGARQGIANVMAYRFKQALSMEVVFPNALLTGEDSWLMVRNGDQIYLKVLAEVKDSKGNLKNKNFEIMIKSGTNDLIWVKQEGKKIYG